MSTTNRASLISKLQKVLKKHYKPVVSPNDRSLLEHLLYACCLENSPNEAADEAFARLQESYFDWNEVRVTTVTELSEVMGNLNDPADAARRLKQSLQSVFETHYSFDIDFLAKQNLGKAAKELAGYKGVSPFVLGYMTQHGLSGHSIPVNKGAFRSLVIVGVITETDMAKRRVPGMERAIPKTKGAEFASLLHQLGVDYQAAPFSNRVRGLLLEVAPDAKERMPKRASKKPSGKKSASTTTGKKPAAKKVVAKKSAPKEAPSKGKTLKKKPAPPKKKSPTKRLTKKKPR